MQLFPDPSRTQNVYRETVLKKKKKNGIGLWESLTNVYLVLNIIWFVDSESLELGPARYHALFN